MAILNLPPIPPPLKSLTPYLQRADEVKPQDPIISYWCAYYATQLGISLKLKDHASRAFLLELLDLLEHIKADIDPNDAIDDEAASAAYVENFALRVFALADGEDRRGNATRATAKKFLAAANFLEVLSTFTQSSLEDATTTINVPEKIRYAKWKAADIAKAIREGRKPAPGSADEQQQQAEQDALAGLADAPDAAPTEPQQPPQEQQPPPASLHPPSPPLPPNTGLSGGGAGADGERYVWVSPELEGREDEYDQDVARVDGEGARVQGGLSPSSPPPGASPFVPPGIPSAPTAQPGKDEGGAWGEVVADVETEMEGAGIRPTHTVHDLPPPSSASAPPLPPPPGVPSVPSYPSSPSAPSTSLPPPPTPYFPPPTSTPSLPPPPASHYSQPALPPPSARRPFTPSVHVPLPPAPEPVASTVTPAAEELSPTTIARIQKHCRFAISALDYEDADQARKELREALRMLGG